jgi:hypothetical protein
MRNTSGRLAMTLFVLGLLSACSGQTGAGPKSVDAGQTGVGPDAPPTRGPVDVATAAPDAMAGKDSGLVGDASPARDLGSEGVVVVDAIMGKDLDGDSGVVDAPVGKDMGSDGGSGQDAPLGVEAGADTGKDVSGVCTPGMPQTCNDSPAASYVAGTCQPNGTCVCDTGFVLNPASGRCGRAAAGTCAGSFEACGCGCCSGVSPTPVCYYPGAGDSLASIKAVDEAAKASPTCATAGCSLGLRYVCCADAPVEPAGNALYSATATMTALDRINLKKTASDGTCVSFTLASPTSVTGVRPFRLTLPPQWGLEGPVATGPCNNPGLLPIIGAQGTVTFEPSGNTCTLSAHLTLFHAPDTAGTVIATRFDADQVPISGGLSSNYCPGKI